MPANLRAGIESLSGIGMDDVRVHHDSPEPAQVQALAFARGADIHLGPGQERHLPHEAWHVVQQKQGRVRATAQAKGIAVNADAALEREADRMGAAALRSQPKAEALKIAAAGPGTVQRMNAPAAAAAAAPVWAPPALPSRVAAEDYVAHRGAPTYVAVEPWQSNNFPPPNAKLRMTFAGTGWPELEAHTHWGPAVRWWNSASPLSLKQGAAPLGHLTAGHALEVGARAQIHAGAAADGLMATLQRRNIPTVTVALGHALQAEAAVAATRIAARGDAMTFLYGDGWLPKARWENGAEAAMRAVLVVAAPPAAPPPAAPLAAAAIAAVPAAAPAVPAAAGQPHAAAVQPVPGAAAGQPGP